VSDTKRLYYLDNLKVALITLVIAHHVGQAYGPTGGDWMITDASSAPVLGAFFFVNRSFFMSLFFMISGYFTVMSYRAKGARPFLKDRLLRFGLPALFFALMMIPMKLFVFGGSLFPLEVGHLWFLEHLLVFSAGYVLWERLRKDRPSESQGQADLPGYRSILLVAVALAVVTGIVRIWFPIDRWEYLLGFFRVAFADVPRDLAFFTIGVAAYKGDWFRKFPTRDGYVWLSVGVGLAAFWYAYELLLWQWLPTDGIGWDIFRLLWEMVFCFGMCIGLTVLFREKFDTQGRLGKAMAQSQYAAYIYHIFVVLLFQFLLADVSLPAFAKFVLVTLAAVPVTFLSSYWLRKPLGL